MKKIGIHHAYAQPNGEHDIWGRIANSQTRRGFLKGAGITALTAALGQQMVYANHYPEGLIPAIWATNDQPFLLRGKDPNLTILNDRPVNAETPAHLLDLNPTPTHRLFIRNNGHPPTNVDAKSWQLTIQGESVKNETSFSIAELKEKFESVTLQLTLECGGNGRAEFDPPSKGNQWTVGAVGCPTWTGIRLADLLTHVGVNDDAVYIAFEGADSHLSGDPSKKPISRGVPLAKAMQPESMIAWAMNGEDLHPMHGFPLRLVFGGWPGSCSGKWLNKILIRNQVHDGPKMTGTSYRVPCDPVPPGKKVNPEDMCIIESMPVKSLVTFPENGKEVELGQSLEVRGYAWAGELEVSSVETSFDFGQTWQTTSLKRPVNRFAWQAWQAEIQFPQKGYFEVWARATDSRGKKQPMVLPGWNPKGYLNNACHRVAVMVRA